MTSFATSSAMGQPLTPRKRLMLLFAALLVLAGSSAAFVSWRRAPGMNRSPVVEIASAYANTRTRVRYVGDAACTRCHQKIAETYRLQPMARSLAPIAEATTEGNTSSVPLFTAQGLEYSIENRDGRVLHIETRRDSSGGIVARNEAEVRYVLGSGSQGTGYLIDRDGFLFQSPISWYVQKHQWDLAPGYDRMNPHFDRPVAATCLFCHANRVEPVAGTMNRYRTPIFQGHGIGCDAVTGPASFTFKARKRSMDGIPRSSTLPG